MALEMNYTLSFEYNNRVLNQNEDFKILFPDMLPTITQNATLVKAYIRVDKIEGDKDAIEIDLGIYADDSKTTVFKKESHQFVPNLDLNTPNFIQQAYEHLKTLPDFSSSVDV